MPFVAALGVVLVTVVTIAKLFLLIPVGLLVSAAALVAWLWPDRKELELMRTSTLPQETGLPIFTTGSKSLGWLGLFFAMLVLAWSSARCCTPTSISGSTRPSGRNRACRFRNC
jgi:hypothetical protein